MTQYGTLRIPPLQLTILKSNFNGNHNNQLDVKINLNYIRSKKLNVKTNLTETITTNWINPEIKATKW